jgi:hypothetical protein
VAGSANDFLLPLPFGTIPVVGGNDAVVPITQDMRLDKRLEEGNQFGARRVGEEGKGATVKTFIISAVSTCHDRLICQILPCFGRRQRSSARENRQLTVKRCKYRACCAPPLAGTILEC